MPSGGSRYYQSTQIRRRDTGGSVQSGLQVGAEVGKLIGGLAGAIHGAQMDAAANKLMNTENAPRAALVSPGGQNVTTTDGGGGSSADTGTPQDLGTLPLDTSTFTNPSTGNVEPLQGQGSSGDQLQKAMTEAQVNSQNAPTAGSMVPGGPQPAQTDDDLQKAMAANQVSGGPQPASSTTRYVPNTIPAGVSTAGTTPFTGGVAGMKLQQEFQKSQMADQIQKLNLARAQRDAANAAAEDAGTGRYAIDAAIKRAQLAAAQVKVLGAGKPEKPVDLEKNPPPAENLDTEPVLNETQLQKTVDKDYGTGTYGGITRTINIPAEVPDPNNPGKTMPNPDPNAPVVSGDSVTIGPKNKRVTMPLTKAQILAKQYNSVNFKKSLPLIRVPGEDQTVGATKDNPYPIQNKLDAKSRAHGTWIRLPDGTIGQVP